MTLSPAQLIPLIRTPYATSLPRSPPSLSMLIPLLPQESKTRLTNLFLYVISFPRGRHPSAWRGQSVSLSFSLFKDQALLGNLDLVDLSLSLSRAMFSLP